VRDNGCGISPDALPHIFDLFTQADSPLRKARGGLGIGLALVRKLIELHGGKVEARSAGLGKGSEFTVTLPLDATPAPVVVEEKAAPLAVGPAVRALVIGDDHDAADSLRMVLECLGAAVRVAYSGERGVEATQAFEPDFVFLDLGMPGLDGFETARLIRRSETGKSLTLVAVTGWGQSEDRVKTRKAGFDAHLTKPASVGALENILRGGPKGASLIAEEGTKFDS
jgi:CheY-like chemotaxis protein